MYRERVKVLVSTKGEFLERKINKAIEELEDVKCIIGPITTNISYHGKEGYMLMATIIYTYLEEDINELDYSGTNLDFGIGESAALNQGDQG